MPSVRLFMFQCGTIRLKVASIWKDKGGDAFCDVPVPWFVIEHPKGNIIIDGGNAEAVAMDARAYWGPIAEDCVPTMASEEFCVSAMRKAGLDPADIRYVFQSHLHHDHAGAIGQFPNATHVVRRREYEYAFAPDWYMAPTYIRSDFDKPGLAWEYLPDEETIDFYGDGTVKLIATPGHSMGHQSFLVALRQSNPILLGVDAVPSMDHWHDRVLPGLTTSASQAVRSIAKLRAIAEKTAAVVVPGHDPVNWPQFRLAPFAYD